MAGRTECQELETTWMWGSRERQVKNDPFDTGWNDREDGGSVHRDYNRHRTGLEGEEQSFF